jgi:hypothetical protein
MAMLRPSAYIADAPLAVFDRAMSLKRKSHGDTILWEPLFEELIDFKTRLARLRKNALKYNKQTLASLHTDLLKLTRYEEQDLLINPVLSANEQAYNQQLSKLLKLIRTFTNEVATMLNSEEPAENSEDFNQFLAGVAQEAMAKGSRVSGKKALIGRVL